MQLELGVSVPAPIEEVFDFLDDQANTLSLGGHAADHTAGIEVINVEPDGRRTFDIHMRSGARTWTQTVEQTIRERPSRLVTRGWTWTTDRNDPYLVITTNRRLTAVADGTRLTMSVRSELRKRSLVARATNWLLRGQARLELEHQLHFLAEHFATPPAARR